MGLKTARAVQARTMGDAESIIIIIIKWPAGCYHVQMQLSIATISITFPNIFLIIEFNCDEYLLIIDPGTFLTMCSHMICAYIFHNGKWSWPICHGNVNSFVLNLKRATGNQFFVRLQTLSAPWRPPPAAGNPRCAMAHYIKKEAKNNTKYGSSMCSAHLIFSHISSIYSIPS